jgi:hypothetical protein
MKFLHPILTMLFLSLPCMTFGEEYSFNCSEGNLPLGIQNLLKSSFADWRIQTLQYLDPYDQKLWKENSPQECPGIALGHFINQSYENF